MDTKRPPSVCPRVYKQCNLLTRAGSDVGARLRAPKSLRMVYFVVFMPDVDYYKRNLHGETEQDFQRGTSSQLKKVRTSELKN